MEDNCKGPLLIGKGMNEMVMGRNLAAHSPDSDCNSNHHHLHPPGSGSASVLSNTSSQDIDFIQDNSDYQWFLDYNCRDNHHTSILSLPESYEAGDLGYYDALAKNMDANLAEVDIESFRTEDIHALLTNLPPMCTTDQLSQESHRQGESYASVSGSMMGKFDFDSSGGHSTSQESANSTSMSICKSELLFSPVKEVPMPGANFSVDSLDCEYNEHDIMLTCQANKDNYTIAFEGSCAMFSEDSGSDYHFVGKSDTTSGSSHWLERKNPLMRHLKDEMTQSDTGSFTTWSKLKKRSGSENNPLRRHPSGNNNNSADVSLAESSFKSQSMPNLYKQRLREIILAKQQRKSPNLSNSTVIKRKPVKVFDIQHQHQQQPTDCSSLLSDMATSIDNSSSCGPDINKPNFNLVKLFMKQKSTSAEGMSTGLDQSSASEWQSHSGQSSSSDKAQKVEDSLSLHPESKENNRREEGTNNNNDSEQKLKSRSTNTRRPSVNNSSNCSTSSSSFSNKNPRKVPIMHLMNKSIQTSTFELKNAPYKLNGNNTKEPVRVIEPSFLNKLKHEGGELQKPVYVLYPNYVLPNLDFLEKEDGISKVYLMPQPTVPKVSPKSRPFSCNDVEALKKKGFGHVQDWESLTLLLPDECKEILSGFPEVAQHIKLQKPVMRNRRLRPASCDCSGYQVQRTSSLDRVSSSSSSGTQPSSGYRGSSSQLSESQNSPATANFNPLFVYKYDSVTSSDASLNEKQRMSAAPPLPKRGASLETVPPRPPLPRGILRKNIDAKHNPSKRYSMYEVREADIMRHKRLSETEDEGVDAGTSSSSLDEPTFRPQSPLIKHDVLFSNISTEELAQLEEFLKMSGISTSDHEDINEESMLQLRSYVSKFLSLKMNQESGNRKCVSFAEKMNAAPNNSPNASALLRGPNPHTKLVDQPICEESESTPEGSPLHNKARTLYQNKSRLIEGVSDAVDKILQSFTTATNQVELSHLSDSNSNPMVAKLTLNYLCPALYAILSDGLKSSLETSFGAITNSVWQVVEASAQQGPLTKALNELVMRINGEDVITEGLVKFNAFVLGLLNVRSLDAWFSYLRTRESILKKHYESDSLLLLSHTGGMNLRVLVDTLITTLQPLALFPFQLDLLFEYRQLHQSLKRMDSYQQPLSPTLKPNKLAMNLEEAVNQRYLMENTTDPSLPDLLNSSAYSLPSRKSDKQRPRSCVDPGKASFKIGEDVNNAMKKRWSGINFTNKLFAAYNRLGSSDEEYTDSLENAHNDSLSYLATVAGEPESLDSNISDEKPLNGRKFKKLQRRWEMLSTKDSPPESPTHQKSKIPRPVTSPGTGRPSGIPVPVSPTSSKQITKNTVKKVVTPPGSINCVKKLAGKNLVSKSPAKKMPAGQQSRISRLDQLENESSKSHAVRPSSLPYKPLTSSSKGGSKITPPRRAVSTSVSRKPNGLFNQLPKVVRTLSHRLPSESGHLPYNEGERLKVVLEVDDKWLLCCRGTQKGLVPKSAVIADTGGRF